MYEYRAAVLRVVDGDTVWMTVDLGFRAKIDLDLRLAGINAPELPTDKGLDAKNWLIDRLNQANPRTLTIRTFPMLSGADRDDKFGRWVAVIMDGEKNINDELVASGHAVPYNGGPR